MNFKIHDNILKYQFFKILTLDFFFFPTQKSNAKGKRQKQQVLSKM